MTVASYLFQSPYSSPVQVGRVDPASQTKEPQAAQESLQVSSQKQQLPAESAAKPTLGGGTPVNLTALQGNAQTTASDFKSLSTVNQAQKAYVNASQA